MKKFHVYQAFGSKRYQWHEFENFPPTAQLLEKVCQYGEEDSKNKILSQKEYVTGEKVKIIESIRLIVHALITANITRTVSISTFAAPYTESLSRQCQ